jgi:N-acetylglutamate synthase/N-acetylornithine aminotransferase
MEKMGCPGFQAAGVASGLKKNGKKDLGLIFSELATSSKRHRFFLISNEQPTDPAGR